MDETNDRPASSLGDRPWKPGVEVAPGTTTAGATVLG